MASTYTYPTNAELTLVAQNLIPNLMNDRPIFEILPVVESQSAIIMWDQRDNYTGLQQVRGLGGSAPRVQRKGAKRYIMEPGAYGEFVAIDETELTMRRPYGTWNGKMDITDLVMDAQEFLLGRRLDRIEQIGWTLLIAGTFSVAGPNGAVLHTDAYTPQTFSAGVAWSTAATSTPLADFRAVQLLARGSSVSFGSSAVAYMNQKTFNRMISNTNNADLYGRRTSGLGTINNFSQLRELFTGDGLPQIVVYDMGYLNDAGTFVPWIADDKVVVVGQRPAGQQVGEYRMTINVNNDDMSPGAYMKVVDENERPPRVVEVHDGHNGGPVIYYPGSIVVMSV